ncbi:CRISPR-associated helicase Cas3' [Blautia producta]|uniref:CRISPR-associated helicase Cas3' n=1 Tax=Blautia producta TaxID=33035 RepID=UPI00210E2680|nr:CRISPR-associated helicase Cas3' [Blautia producta]MCQ4745811.1 CRISPR-associated helicase Cas3' [Blautia producta]
MDKINTNFEKNKYIAHVIPETGDIQFLEQHLLSVEKLSSVNCPLQLIKNLVVITAILHDSGKFCLEFQDYMQAVIESNGETVRRKIDHSTAGGRIALGLLPGTLLAKMISIAVYCHHGLQDCIDLESAVSLEEERQKKEIDMQTICSRYFKLYPVENLKKYCLRAQDDVQILKDKIKTIAKSGGRERIYGTENFFLGMYERILLSLLLDSDWSDTAAFNQHVDVTFRKTADDTQRIWSQCIRYFESYLTQMRKNKKDSPVDKYRQEISEYCRKTAITSCRLYRLTVPTGAGKTLSSLRFALYHAEKFKKKHIIYVAPYNSVLEQNASEIREAIGKPDIVLEHHCNVVQENDEDEERYRQLSESWDCPVIVTTAVQLLNSLYSSSKMSLRRMHVLCNSVIIFDEVQAFPVKCTELFNLAVNFLTSFCSTTVVLCSATQPSLAKIPQNRVLESKEMIENPPIYVQAFKRTNIIDKTQLKSGGLEVEDLLDFVEELIPKQNKILIIVNTKPCAKEVFNGLKERYGGQQHHYLFHLSANMCPVNRKSVLRNIKKKLDEKKSEEDTVICVSTQLVEAGVDFSFKCVIRSMAGLDNIIQAAGRCNRHRERDSGDVYIVKMSQKAENLSRNRDIRDAQTAMEEVLYQFNSHAEIFSDDLSSLEAVTYYYNRYYLKKVGVETNFPACVNGIQTTLVELLSNNLIGYNRYEAAHKNEPVKRSRMLNQAFKTAGDIFEVIDEDGKVKVVAAYDGIAKKILNELENPYIDAVSRRRNLRAIQGYTVGISMAMKDRLGRAVSNICEGRILVLSDDYYDEETGVLENPKLKNMFM